MKKILFAATMLSLTVQPALAENWVRYAQSNDAIRYYDKERTMSMGGTAFIWDLHDLKPSATGEQDGAFRSVLYAVEVNCRKEQRRVLSFHRMSGAMGAGTVVNEHSMVSEWSEPVAQTPDAQLMAIACELK